MLATSVDPSHTVKIHRLIFLYANHICHKDDFVLEKLILKCI